jgi:hypothetical protein
LDSAVICGKAQRRQRNGFGSVCATAISWAESSDVSDHWADILPIFAAMK